MTESLPEKIREDESKDTIVSKPTIPVCPAVEIAKLFNATVTNLSKVNKLSPAMKTNISARWKQEKDYQDIEKWKKLFIYCDTNTFLSGQIEGDRNWRATLQWIITSKNFYKILNGDYDR